MDLNLFENKEKTGISINKFIEELTNALNNVNNKNETTNKGDLELEEYDLYEKKKIFLDNKSRKGNEIAWVIDEDSVCISKHGDGGAFSIKEIDLPDDIEVRKCI